MMGPRVPSHEAQKKIVAKENPAEGGSPPQGWHERARTTGGRIAARVEPTTTGAKGPEPKGSKEDACDDEAVVVEDPSYYAVVRAGLRPCQRHRQLHSLTPGRPRRMPGPRGGASVGVAMPLLHGGSRLLPPQSITAVPRARYGPMKAMSCTHCVANIIL